MQATHTTSRREELEENMREDLIKFYRKYYSNIPVSPLVEEHDVPLTEFYVQPPLTSIDIQRKFGHCQEFPKKTSIHSYRDVFFRGDGELYKDIYITANAGVGKTSFAKKICMTWCQAHRPTETLEQTFKSEDINSMKTFEFLFMVSLRDVDTSICDLDSMIEISILHYLARCSRFSRLDLEDILNERTCLVLLDGLDEWAHPTSCVRGRRDVHATPHIPARERCTILTTTRPWKLDVIKLGTSQIDRHIEINELDETSSKELTSNAITVLNRQSLPDQPKTVEEFESATSTLKLDNLRYIPYILLQMICLWFDGKSIGRTKCEIYTNIITLTLSRGLLKIENKGLPPMRGQNLETTYEIPPCLKSIDICKSHYEVLIGLAFLAFKKLFSSKAERNLVFDRSEVLQVISEDILRFCLEIGFLSQNKDYGLVSGRRSILSFQHKSVQEYFAALYISSHNQDIKDDIYKVCDTLPAILEMSNVFIFLAGFSPATVGKILQTIGETLSRDEKIEYFRNSIINSKSYVPKQVECWEIMKSWQRMLTDSVQEISNSGQSNAYLYIEDLLIDSTISKETCCILKLLTENNTEKIKSISISECRTPEEFTDKLETLGLQDKHSLHILIIQALPKAKDLHRLLSGSVQTLTVLILEFIIFQNRLLNREIMEIPSETVSILSSMTNMQIIYLRRGIFV
ncbi:uncharacterized protein LOC128548332 [Mercenaria mercenaria]|uniref:uncharacterized protein LOC128548332 n=1 Tax=Mercenaria mercenaria TaxID=6596 RepID=UPI00234F6F1D|nr:uncharacterized protein LOC128548332 [Mercenaria mercenaria]